MQNYKSLVGHQPLDKMRVHDKGQTMNVNVWRLMVYDDPTDSQLVVEWSKQAGRIAIG